MVSGPQAPVFILKKTWKKERALLILNKSSSQPERFRFPDWDRWLDWPVLEGVMDVSPGHRADKVPLPLDVELAPAQVIVLLATCDPPAGSA
jgi:hypothetical protein